MQCIMLKHYLKHTQTFIIGVRVVKHLANLPPKPDVMDSTASQP